MNQKVNACDSPSRKGVWFIVMEIAEKIVVAVIVLGLVTFGMIGKCEFSRTYVLSSDDYDLTKVGEICNGIQAYSYWIDVGALAATDNSGYMINVSGSCYRWDKTKLDAKLVSLGLEPIFNSNDIKFLEE